MKIENIIEDIKKDIAELTDSLEEQFRTENPLLNFTVSMPGIDELTTIKSIAMLIEEDNTVHYLSVQIHTHNGNRVFENEPMEIVDHLPVPGKVRHPFQDRFVDLLRDIIKKKKHQMKLVNKPAHHHHNKLHAV